MFSIESTKCTNNGFDVNGIDPTTTLPNDLIFEIFSHLSAENLNNLVSVSKTWQELSCNDNAWTSVAKEMTEDFRELTKLTLKEKFKYFTKSQAIVKLFLDNNKMRIRMPQKVSFAPPSRLCYYNYAVFYRNIVALIDSNEYSILKKVNAIREYINTKNTEKHVPLLTHAVEQESLQILNLLLKLGANPNRTYDAGPSHPCYHTALEAAITIGNYEAAKILLDAGADPFIAPPFATVFESARKSEKLMMNEEKIQELELYAAQKASLG